jgi:AcrR family transcriptional regulator
MTGQPHHDETVEIAGQSLRVRKKNEKTAAILKAARHLFTSKGYEATTLREVAKIADVGFGTVFAYSKDKSGLLCMLIVDDLRHMPPIFPAATSEAELADELTEAFLAIYRFWAKTPDLSRIVLPQMEFPQLNPFASIIKARRGQTRGELRNWLVHRQRERRIGPDIDVEQAADTIFAVFTSCLREWIGSETLDLDAGRKRLKRLLGLPLAAMRADASGEGRAPGPSGIEAARRR